MHRGAVRVDAQTSKGSFDAFFLPCMRTVTAFIIRDVNRACTLLLPSILIALQVKWGKLKELPIPLHIGAEDLLKILKLPDFNALHYEVRYLSRYVDEEYLFKVGLSTQAERLQAQILKRSVKASEAIPQKNQSKRPGSDGDLQAPKKK
ncbi:hypothetical protein IEQ34_015658 [Dendrobium chrysotoxum]|uniref:Uncharacterized protein n=1 Tax=Dendrobium chrysotoxum TaxID=161865 RepID=A0AAV7GGH7_DENCH|nr:hypothetical protein IEQ34_015658 [Dendrobium chrysotoxum]